MAYSFNLNNTPATGAAAMFLLKTLLKAQGWTVPSSSDGTTYNAAGDQISTGVSGAGGMANAKAWFRIKSPNGREFCIQRSASNNTDWRIYYSISAGFVTGAPSATVVPTATDFGRIIGSGSDAVPTMNTLFGTDGAYRFNCAADASSPYGFYSVGWPSGGGAPNHLFMMDPLVDLPAGDLEPYVFYANTNVTYGNADWMNGSGTFPPQTWMNKGGGNQLFGTVNVLGYVSFTSGGTTTVPIGNLGSNAVSGRDDLLPCFYSRNQALTSPFGYKGRSTLLVVDVNTASTGNTLSIAGPSTLERVLIGQFGLLWDGATTPLV